MLNDRTVLLDRDIVPLRMRALGLTERLSPDPVVVAEHFLAIQGQDLPGCLWALGCRSGACLDDLIQAFDQGKLVRSWPFRGTLHVVPAPDVGWLHSLRPLDRTDRAAQRLDEYLELTQGEVERAGQLAAEILAGGRAMTRHQLFDAMAPLGLEVERRLRYRISWYLVRSDRLILGPMQDGEQLVALADEWITNRRQLAPAAAVAQVAARFVAGHGPVTDRDLARWTAYGLGSARAGLRDAGDQLVAVPGQDGQTWWLTAAAWADHQSGAADDAAWRGLRLLPAFDEHILGYGDRTAQLDPADEVAVCPGRNGVFKPTVLVDGRVVATWTGPSRGVLAKQSPERPIKLTISPFDPRRARQIPKRALARAAQDYATYLNWSAGAEVVMI